MRDRRNHPRRALFGGLLLGLCAALLLGLLDAAFALLASASSFDTAFDRARFTGHLILLSLPLGALFGALCGAAVAVAHLLTRRLVRRARRDVWSARFYTLLVVPAVAVTAAQLFRGRRAQLLPAHQILPIVAGLAALAVVYLALIAAIAVARRLDAGMRGGRALALLLLVAAAGLHLADQRLLPRLYPFFHHALFAGELALLLAAAGCGYLSLQRRGRVGRLAEPVFALALLCAAVAGGAFSLRRAGRDELLRATIYQHASAGARLLDGARALSLLRAAPPAAPIAAPAPTAPPLPAGPTFPDADLFLITVDAMRADRLSERTAPHLAALARTGVAFDQAYAQVPHTSFSLATLLTGKYVYSLTALGGDTAGHETLADVFQRDRYKTAAFFPPSVFFIDHEHFAEVERTSYHFEYVKYEHLGARGRTDQVIDFLTAEKPARAFVWIHYFEPHEPYELHEGIEAGETDEARYDGEVRFVDGEIQRLLDWLSANRPRAVVAFTADHGEEFGEHGGRYHGTTLYEEQVHVPLFVATLNGLPPLGTHRVAAPVGLIDVAPTLLGLAGITASARMRGQDLGPWLAASPAPAERLAPVFAEIGSRKLLAAGADRLVCDLARDACELYDLSRDAAETQNLIARAPERVEPLRARLAAWMADQSAFEAPAALPDAARRALERGRLGDRSAAADLASLLVASEPAVAAEAARVLLALPDDPAVRSGIGAASAAHPDDLVLRVLAFRGGDASVAAPLAAWAGGSTPDPDGTHLRAEIALALAAQRDKRAVPLLARALADGPPEEVKLRLIAALGESRDPKATAPLVAELEDVRVRLEAVRALGVLGDRGAAARLAASLDSEPYVPVRAETARVLGVLGDKRAVGPLRRLLASEREAQVASECRRALERLGVAKP